MNQGLWEDASCPICPASTGSDPYLLVADRLRESRLRNYHLVRCRGCGLIFLNPRPAADALGNHHDEPGYDPFVSFAGRESLYDRIYRLARSYTSHWKRRITRNLTPSGARILDIGCGTGEYLAAIADNYITAGIEPEPKAAQWARERLGLNVFTGDLNSLPAAGGGFHLITMWHALEHIPNPLDVLVRVRSLLNPGGKLLIALPNPLSLDARIYREHWIALDAPRHLWHFGRPQLEQLAGMAGFKLYKAGMLPLDTFYNALGSERSICNSGRLGACLALPLRLPLVTFASLLWGALSGSHSGRYYVFKSDD